ncbi:dimethylallyltransferase [Streptomyces spectabilis]|uniref:Geranylgeranyl diphosphate synthase type I n=1 Tax=Streptomyces spectabilis TaxID=68270 RepID=A0A7W8B4H5_STRST|nr:polyprenyl synthetase family protein [Streptomyces spectabilis]MBB5109566.1 geranylgeranyl diphosphate synthase type I [Streptomyces spectabilis]GGV55762.1 dimethylallyltransferase [Streptomyces spectabilis]
MPTTPPGAITSLTAGEEHLPPVLSRAHMLTEAALRLEIGRLPPPLAKVSEYHLGWCDAAGNRRRPGGGGKGVCLALPILSAEAAGAEAARGVPGAVALELVHISTHMHDDIMDGDAWRRHRESVWKVFGIGPAILTGDALLVLALRVLAAAPVSSSAAVRTLSDACLDLAAGQALDLAYEGRALEDVDFEDYLDMAGGKTGALYSCALSIGAELVGAPAPAVTALRKAGRDLGIVAQIVDDINGIWGAPAVTGKPVLGDLLRRKKSLPVIAVLRAQGSVRERFLELWLVDKATDRTARAMLAALEDAHAREFCNAQAERYYQQTLAHLEGLDMPDRVRAGITDLGRFIRHRQA